MHSYAPDGLFCFMFSYYFVFHYTFKQNRCFKIIKYINFLNLIFFCFKWLYCLTNAYSFMAVIFRKRSKNAYLSYCCSSIRCFYGLKYGNFREIVFSWNKCACACFVSGVNFRFAVSEICWQAAEISSIANHLHTDCLSGSLVPWIFIHSVAITYVLIQSKLFFSAQVEIPWQWKSSAISQDSITKGTLQLLK